MFSKGLVGFLLGFGIFVLGFWLMYDLSVKNAVETEAIKNESRGQMESVKEKIDIIKDRFMVEIDKINEANNREGGAQAQGGSGSSVGQINQIEKQIKSLSREVRQLKAIIREYEDM